MPCGHLQFCATRDDTVAEMHNVWRMPSTELRLAKLRYINMFNNNNNNNNNKPPTPDKYCPASTRHRYDTTRYENKRRGVAVAKKADRTA